MLAAVRARFFDGQRALSHDVLLTVRDGVALIRSSDDGVSLDWSLSDLVAQMAPDGCVTFRLGRNPARLIVADPTALRALQPGRRRWPRLQAGWAVVLAACAAVVGLGVFLVDELPDLLAPLVPLAWEAPLGSAVQTLLLTQHPQCIGADGQRALERLVREIAASGNIDRSVRILVLDSPQVNAFTLPGDRVLVMRGLIAAARDGDELAGVLAHELGHIAHHDPARQMLRQLGFRAVEAALGWGGIDSGGFAGMLLGASYGRAAETAADRFAVTTLRYAGLRADGLAHFFSQIETDGSGGGGFLSDHPPTAERRERTTQPVDGAPAFEDAEWHAVRTMCRPS